MASKSKSRRRVLRASCLLAALIVAGSSFAWFTSKDEVTNRLSASSNYGVAIAENFTPPEDWVPGQTINKDVSATNTGNVDAFVKMKAEGEMRILAQNATVPEAAKLDSMTATFNSMYETDGSTGARTLKDVNTVASDELKGIGLTAFTDASGVKTYYKTLSTTQTDNAKNSGDGDLQAQGDTDGGTNSSVAYSEVQSVQAGGYLAYAPINAEYTFVINQAEKVKAVDVSNKTTASKDDVVECAKDTRIVAVPSDTGAYTTGAKIGTTTIADDNAKFIRSSATANLNNTKIDSDSFKPLTEGLYLFRRNIDLDTSASSADTKYEFSGYYFVPDGSKEYGKGTYYALNYTQSDTDATPKKYSDYTLDKNDTTVLELKYDQNAAVGENLYSVEPKANLALFTAKYTEAKSSDLVWKYTAATYDGTTLKTPAKLTAYYKGLDGQYLWKQENGSNKNYSSDDIAVEVTLANIFDASNNSGAETWTAITDTATTAKTGYTYRANSTATSDSTLLDDTVVFYYNNDLEAGDTTAKLIDSVKLADTVTQKAFLAFDFDLNVFLDSIQVTKDEDGVESAIPVANATSYTVDGSAKSDGVAQWAGTAATAGASVTAVTNDTTDTYEIKQLTWTKTTT